MWAHPRRFGFRRARTPFLGFSGLAAISLLAAMSLSFCLEPAVLCIGSDGHRDIESLAGGCCSPFAPFPDAGEVTLRGTGQPEPSCGACFDLTLETPRASAWQPRSAAVELHATGVAVMAPVAVGSSEDSDAPVPSHAPARFPRSIEVLSTVILLT